MFKINIKEMLSNFLVSSKRIVVISKKPGKDEFLAMAKITGLGIVIIGIIGFIVTLIFTLFL